MKSIGEVKNLSDGICANIAKVLYGKDDKIKLIVTALFAGGHVLLDDIPGTGKTSLARALAKSVSADVKRVQFTPDLLPSDITGINYYDQKQNEFVFRPGPVFTNVLIADEINRTTPRTQSALLECMGEFQTTVDGQTYAMKSPFFVIATQNPMESQGTFPLPEAQMDRFLMKTGLGYPDVKSEADILSGYMIEFPLDGLTPICRKEDICEAIKTVKSVNVSDRIKNYIVGIVNETRSNAKIRLGVSPRGTLALMRAAQSYAATEGRDYVLPDDVKSVAVAVLSHRIIVRSQNTIRSTESGENLIRLILDTYPSPIEK